MNELRRDPSAPDHQPDPPTDPRPAAAPRDTPRPTPTEDTTTRHEPPPSTTEPSHRPNRDAPPPRDRPAEPTSPPTRRTADASTNQTDPFVEYSPELRARMVHDDTLARLQYLSKPSSEPHAAAAPRPVDTETTQAPGNQADLPSENRAPDNLSENESPTPTVRDDRTNPDEASCGGTTVDRDHSTVASDSGRPNTAETIREIHETLGASHPDVADVVERLVEDKKHPLDLVASLNDRERRPAVLMTVRELADENLLGGRSLDEFRADNPGHGPLFSSTPHDVNQNDDGRSRKSLYVAQCKNLDAAREVGVNPSADDRDLVDDYGRRLAIEVLPAVRFELLRSAQAAEGDLSTRAKTAAGLHDKVERMSDGGDGRPARTGYQVGDVIDAVGARIVVPDTEALEFTLADIQERFGTGDGGRILEIENMYHEPKAHNPSYRVVPCIVAIEVERMPYTFELQLCTRRASIASDLEHNTVYKPYINPTAAEQEKIRRMQAEAAALGPGRDEE